MAACLTPRSSRPIPPAKTASALSKTYLRMTLGGGGIDVRHPEAQFTEIPARNMPTAEYYVELVNATLGVERTMEDLLFESEVAYTLHKLINLRQGFRIQSGPPCQIVGRLIPRQAIDDQFGFLILRACRRRGDLELVAEPLANKLAS